MASELTCPLCGRTCRGAEDWRGHLLGRHRKSEIVADLEHRVRGGTVAERDRPTENYEQSVEGGETEGVSESDGVEESEELAA